MQDAETVLGVLRDRGRRGLPLNELYRQLFNPQLYELAYGRIYANKGAMTPGAVSIHPLKGGRDHRWAGWASGAGGAGTWSGGCG